MYKDIWGYDMKNVEFEEMCREAWSDFYCLCVVMARNKKEGKYRTFNESKNT